MRFLLKNGVTTMALASICSISAEGQDPPATGDIGADLAEDAKEIEAGFAQLFADAKAGNISAVVQDVEKGAAWTVNAINQLSEDAQTFLTAVKAKVSAEATSVDDAVERALNLINNPSVQASVRLGEQAIADLKNLPSEALATAIGIVQSAESAI